MEWSYNFEKYKTKLNWFLMEIALEYYGHIMDSQTLASYRKQYDDKQIAQYCAYCVMRTKDGLLKFLRGKRKCINIYKKYIGGFYPYHSHQLNRVLSAVAEEVLEQMLSAC